MALSNAVTIWLKNGGFNDSDIAKTALAASKSTLLTGMLGTAASNGVKLSIIASGGGGQQVGHNNQQALRRI